MTKKTSKIGKWFILCGGFLIVIASAFFLKEVIEDYALKRNNRALINQIHLVNTDLDEPPAGSLNPNAEMPVRVVNGIEYVGTLQIPRLGVELPIINECTDAYLKIAPCRYSGSIYLDNFVIAGHNYISQFGCLYRVKQGDQIIFWDMEQRKYAYVVSEVETLSAFSVEKMTEGKKPLTLFTCTLSGSSRITVRCDKDIRATDGDLYASES